MSRIGKKKIKLPESVEVEASTDYVLVKSEKEKKIIKLDPRLKVNVLKDQVCVEALKKGKDVRRVHGLTRALLKNAIAGISKGFTRKLEFSGVGFKVLVQGNELVLNIGFSHEVKIKIPEGIEASVEKNLIKISGKDKQEVSNFASSIKKHRPVEPYKGKGIMFSGEYVRRKAGKTVGKEEE